MNTPRKARRVYAFLASCLLFAGLTARLTAGDQYFATPQYGSSYVSTVGDAALDNPSMGPGTPVYPASSLDMPFVDPFGAALFTATVDTSVAKGSYYIGYFSGGSAYVYIY